MVFSLWKFISEIILVSIISSFIKLNLIIFSGLLFRFLVIWFRLWIKIISCQFFRFFYFLLKYSLLIFLCFHHFILNFFFFLFLNIADFILLNFINRLFLRRVYLAALRWIWRSKSLFRLRINCLIQLLWLTRYHFRNGCFQLMLTVSDCYIWLFLSSLNCLRVFLIQFLSFFFFLAFWLFLRFLFGGW